MPGTYFAHRRPESRVPSQPVWSRPSEVRFKRNKTFFFADWQGTRLRTGITRIQRRADDSLNDRAFSLSLFSIQHLATRHFPNNTIPCSRFDPIARPGSAALPVAERSGAANNFVRTAPNPTLRTRPTSASIATSARIIGFSAATPISVTTILPSLPSGRKRKPDIRRDRARHHARRRLRGRLQLDALRYGTLNQFRVGYSRRDLNQVSLQNGGITVPGLPANSFSSVLPIFTVAGYQQIGPTTAANSNFTTSVTEFVDTLSRTRGRHTIKFGIDIVAKQPTS